GAFPFMENVGRTLESVTLADLGRCERAIIDKESTKIIKGKGKKQDVQARIALTRSATEATNSTYDKEKLQERLARLSGGVAVVKLGGATGVEVRNKRDLIEDALAATRAAIAEGIVPGG